MKLPSRPLDVLFLGLLASFSFALPAGAWQANPFWLILFARVNNIAFTNVHLSSVFAVSAVCAYLVIRDRKTVAPFKWVAVVFAGAGIHEWMLFLWDWVILKAPLVAWQDGIWFAVFIALGVALGNRRQRMVLGVLAVYLFVLMGIYVGYFHDSDLQIGLYTRSAIADNFIEVFGWVTTPMAFLFVGRQRVVR